MYILYNNNNSNNDTDKKNYLENTIKQYIYYIYNLTKLKALFFLIY